MKTNIIYNKDCMEIFKELPNESIDLIVTDPPYPVTLRGNSGNAGGMFLKDRCVFLPYEMPLLYKKEYNSRYVNKYQSS